jgi:hypothetical protein
MERIGAIRLCLRPGKFGKMKEGEGSPLEAATRQRNRDVPAH